MAIHGSAYTTEDLDLAYARDADNIEKIVAALAPLRPRLRVSGEPGGVAFLFDAMTIANALNLTLVTTAGNIDLLGSIDGFAGYADIKRSSAAIEVFSHTVYVLSLGGLIHAKRITGRPKDLLAIPELELLKESQERQN